MVSGIGSAIFHRVRRSEPRARPPRPPPWVKRHPNQTPFFPFSVWRAAGAPDRKRKKGRESFWVPRPGAALSLAPGYYRSSLRDFSLARSARALVERRTSTSALALHEPPPILRTPFGVSYCRAKAKLIRGFQPRLLQPTRFSLSIERDWEVLANGSAAAAEQNDMSDNRRR